MVGFPGGASGKETACQFRRPKRLEGKGLGNQFHHPLLVGRRGYGNLSPGPELVTPAAVSTGKEGGSRHVHLLPGPPSLISWLSEALIRGWHFGQAISRCSHNKMELVCAKKPLPRTHPQSQATKSILQMGTWSRPKMKNQA